MENGCCEVSPDLILAQPSSFAADVETFGPEGPQVVVAVVRSDVFHYRDAERIGGSHDRV